MYCSASAATDATDADDAAGSFTFTFLSLFVCLFFLFENSTNEQNKRTICSNLFFFFFLQNQMMMPNGGMMMPNGGGGMMQVRRCLFVRLFVCAICEKRKTSLTTISLA